MTGKQQTFFRVSMTIALAFVLIWAFCAELWSGLRAAFKFAWLEVRSNVAAYRALMRQDDY
jgi:hypothetical protein